eukprot:COSAG05_NODE_38_length_27626_cov_78.614306_7_plen_57_part_00
MARDVLSDGSEGPTLKERVERHYFPERFGFHIFGDPWETKRYDTCGMTRPFSTMHD